MEDFADTVKAKIVTALEPLEQLTARAQVGQPASQAANVLLHHCAAAKAAHLLRMLPPHSTGELANTVDKHIIRSFARINNMNEEELEKNSLILSLLISEGGMGLKRLNWMKEGARVASWLQCARRVDELIGEAVPQIRNWREAALPCQQAVKLAHSNMVDNEGVDAIKILGTSWETLHLSCRAKLQKAIALKITAIRRDRWFVQANARQQQVALSGSTRNQRSGAGAWVKTAPASEKNHDAGPTI